MTTVDFATFCYSGDAHRLHKLGHLEMQVSSNRYPFSQVIVIYQLCDLPDFNYPIFPDCHFSINACRIDNLDYNLIDFGIDIDKPQYQSPTDKHHTWKQHVANHVMAANVSNADYIVFADLDCWMVRQPAIGNWVEAGIAILQHNPDVFIVSPNDGESERKTQVISQQMFLTRLDDFRQADFNQPGYSGNPRDYPELPEYHAMAEGRIHYYCKSTGRYRYVLSPEYRYWHHNRTTPDGYFETDMSKY
jgi:hypothetical protein